MQYQIVRFFHDRPDGSETVFDADGDTAAIDWTSMLLVPNTSAAVDERDSWTLFDGDRIVATFDAAGSIATTPEPERNPLADDEARS